jgi:hypothetical protein
MGAPFKVFEPARIQDGYTPIVLKPFELAPFLPPGAPNREHPSMQDQVSAFLMRIQTDGGCKTMQDGYKRLASLPTRTITYPNDEHPEYHVRFDLNQGRKRNLQDTEKEIANHRPCFLCARNMKPGERVLRFDENTVIAGNPYPYMEGHLVIINRLHVPQRPELMIDTALDFAKEAQSHFVLHNGRGVGATAPDHAHLQAGLKSNLPIFDDLRALEKKDSSQLMHVDLGEKTDAFTVPALGRDVLVIRATSKEDMLKSIRKGLEYFPPSPDPKYDGDPSASQIFTYENGTYTAYMFPRPQFRPAEFEQGTVRTSPAAAEAGGLFPMPDTGSFLAGDKAIPHIYHQVTGFRSDLPRTATVWRGEGAASMQRAA